MVRIRVGLNAGEVVVRATGSDLHMGLHGRRPNDVEVKPLGPRR